MTVAHLSDRDPKEVLYGFLLLLLLFLPAVELYHVTQEGSRRVRRTRVPIPLSRRSTKEDEGAVEEEPRTEESREKLIEGL